MFNKFARSMVYGRAFTPMMDADTGAGAGSGAGDSGAAGAGDNPGGEGNTGKGDNPDDKGKGESKVTFTEEQQRHVDSLIGQKVAAERTKAEQKAAEAAAAAEAKAKMTAEERAEAERKEREEKANEREAKANEKIVRLEVKDAAAAAGVPRNKVERFMRLVDIKSISINDDGDADRSEVEKAVNEILADMPEFKGPENPKGPGGDFGGNGSGAKYSMQQIKEMSTEEVAANYDEIQKSLAIHNKK